MSAVIQFPARRQRNIRIERERGTEGWLVIRGEHGWLHGDCLSAFLEARNLAAADSTTITVQP